MEEDNDSIFGYEDSSKRIIKPMYYPLNDKAFMKMKIGSGSFPDGKLSL